MPIVPDPRIIARAATANESILARGIRHAVYLQRYKTTEVNRIVGLLNNSIVPDLVEQLSIQLPKIGEVGYAAALRKHERYQSMLDGIAGLIQGGVREGGKRLKEDMQALALTEAQWTEVMLRELVPFNIDFALPSTATLKALVTESPINGLTMDAWFDGMSQGTIKKVEQQLSIGLTEGESIDQLIARIRGTKDAGYKDGVMETSRRSAEAIVRTSATHVSAVARETTYAENDDLIDKVQWVSTLDDRTTILCASRDGQTYPVNEGPRPPAHPNCRSTTVPVMKSWKELGIKAKEAEPSTRASMDGEVADTVTYDDWLRDQPEGVQNDVLGKEKADIFRKGDLPLAKFVDDKGRELTLAELRKLEGMKD